MRRKIRWIFVLWKPKKEGEPYWESPWGQCRTGIECSVMSRNIWASRSTSTAGEDLIFPHHENEIAQSEARSCKEFSHYWMHNAFLLLITARCPNLWAISYCS
ncbi:MAG: hypothetical protein ACLTI1_11700 [Clostridia bacterium]